VLAGARRQACQGALLRREGGTAGEVKELRAALLSAAAVSKLLGWWGVAVAGTQFVHKFNAKRYFWSALFWLSECILTKQLSRIHSSPFYSVLTDSSTDVGREDHMMVYIQYMDPDTYTVQTEYLCTVQIALATSDVVYAALTKTLEVFKFDLNKCIGFCSDGASVFTGTITGVAVKMRQLVRWVVCVHCAAHRCALVMTAAADSKFLITEIQNALQ